MRSSLIHSFILVMAVLMITNCCSSHDEATLLVTPIADWRAQDYSKNLGITGVSYDQGSDRLVLDCDLMGNDPAGVKDDRGEIVLDLKYVPALECSIPVDMTGRRIEVEIEIPDGFIDHPALNGIQIFVKDDRSKSQYGTWANISRPGNKKIEFRPSTETPKRGHTEQGFDPKMVRTIGVKTAINTESDHRYKGQLYVSKVKITPPLPFISPPALPEHNPVPFVTGKSAVSMKPDGFYVDKNRWFIVGGNWRVIEYGQNFGTTNWYPIGNGVSRHPGYVSTKLELFRRAGITLVRVGLLDDGVAMFDREGKVIGYNQTFRDDVSALLNLAEKHDVKVEFVLVDFLLAGKEEYVNGVWVRGRREVIENEGTRALFLTDFLEPFLREFGGHPALFGFDVINEPEWIVSKSDGGGWEDVTDADKAVTPVNGDQFRSFVSECIGKIHELAPGKFVTAGVSLIFVDLIKDFDLDYYAFHYYPYMGDFDDALAGIPGDKPWVLEEFPGKGNLTDYLNAVKQAGGAGALLWNLSPEIDRESYKCKYEGRKLLEIRTFIDKP
jgi:hypothetical protein